MFWTTEAASIPAGGYFIQMKEWEMNESGGYDLSDIDEPAISAGRTFDSLSELLTFARDNGLRISNIREF